MSKPVRTGFPVIGVIFLALAVLKFFQGGDWVVWLILGLLFGGLGVFTRNRATGDQA